MVTAHSGCEIRYDWVDFSLKIKQRNLRSLSWNTNFLLFQMLCSPVSSGRRKIRTHESSGRGQGRPWPLCTLTTNSIVSDVLIPSHGRRWNTWTCSAWSIWSLVSGLAGIYAGRAKIDGATLTIHAVTQKDSGEYRCEVTASQDHVNLGEASVTLNVLGMMGKCLLPCHWAVSFLWYHIICAWVHSPSSVLPLCPLSAASRPVLRRAELGVCGLWAGASL